MTQANTNMPLPLTDAESGGDGEPQPSPAELSRAGVIIAIPVKEEQRPSFNDKAVLEPSVQVDVIIPGSGTFEFGAAPTKGRPAAYSVALPARINGVWFRGNTIWPLQGKCGKGAVLGVIEQGTLGTKGNPPWMFNAPAENDTRRAGAVATYNMLGLADESPKVPINGYVPNAVAAAAPVADGPSPVPGFTMSEFMALPAPMRANLMAAAGPAPAAAPAIPPAPAGFEQGWTELTDAQRSQIVAKFGTGAATV